MIIPMIYESASALRAESVSMAVAITVLVLLFLSYAALFFLYYRYFKKSVDYRIEDHYILRDMVRRSKPFFEKAGKEYDEKVTTAPSYSGYLEQKAKRARGWKILGNTVLIAFYLVLVGVTIGAISIRAQGETFAIGDSSFIVIKTGSMEEANPQNSYLAENNLDNQILTYSLIELKAVNDPSEMEVYDIYAFKADDTIYVHRLIDTLTGSNGETRYIFRGDANTATASFEASVGFEQIIGVYTGWNSFELGIFVNYAQSYIGIITFFLALILIGFYDILDAAIGKRIEAREAYLTQKIDQDLASRFAARSGYPYALYLDRHNKVEDLIPPFLLEPKAPARK